MKTQSAGFGFQKDFTGVSLRIRTITRFCGAWIPWRGWHRPNGTILSKHLTGPQQIKKLAWSFFIGNEKSRKTSNRLDFQDWLRARCKWFDQGIRSNDDPVVPDEQPKTLRNVLFDYEFEPILIPVRWFNISIMNDSQLKFVWTQNGTTENVSTVVRSRNMLSLVFGMLVLKCADHLVRWWCSAWLLSRTGVDTLLALGCLCLSKLSNGKAQNCKGWWWL